MSIRLLRNRFGSRIDFCRPVSIPDGPLPIRHMEAVLEALPDSPFPGRVFHLHFEVPHFELELVNAEQQLPSSLPVYLDPSLRFVDINIHVAMLHERVVIHVEPIIILLEEHPEAGLFMALLGLADPHTQHLERSAFDLQIAIGVGIGLLQLIDRAELVLFRKFADEGACAYRYQKEQQQQRIHLHVV